MNILVIIGNYYPFPSSTANCIKPVLHSLIEKGHKITILTNTYDSKRVESHADEIFGTEIYCIPNKYFYYIKKLKRTHYGKYIGKVSKNLWRIVILPLYLRYQASFSSRFFPKGYINYNYNIFHALNIKQPFDLMFTISHPFDSQFIGLYIKKRNRNLKWVVYEFDPYAYSYHYKISNNREKFEKLELRVISYADKIIGTPELIKFYKTTKYSIFFDKMNSLPYIIRKEKKQIYNYYLDGNRNNQLLFTYAGTFYLEIRNPLPALAIMRELKIDYKLLLLTDYEELEFLNILKNEKKFMIQNYSSSAETMSLLNLSNIFVSIGNTVEIQVPAKIFEYMGFGKPIIHFSKIINDPARDYLSKYPLALIVNEYEGSIDEKVEAIERFVEEVKNKKMTYSEVIEHLPNHDEKIVAGKFLSIINSI